MTDHLRHYIDAIQRSGLSIYDPIEVGDPELWIPTPGSGIAQYIPCRASFENTFKGN
jgi:hypothetical protein